MSLKSIVSTVCSKIHDLLISNEFIDKYKVHPQDFTRNRKLNFFDTTMLVFNKTGKSVRSDIRDLLCNGKKNIDYYSVQAFSKGRRRIKPDAFKELSRTSAITFYQKAKLEKFKGYRVSAVDGSKISLPYHKDSVVEFGIQKSSGNQIQSLSSGLYDVLNEIVIDSTLGPFDASELDFAKDHIEYLASISHDKELIIFDRGYPSAKLIDTIEKNQFKYLMRCNTTFIEGIKKLASSNDCIVDYTFKKAKIRHKIRFIKLTLESGNEEYLVTNIYDQSFTVSDFKELYHFRWEIETNYDIVKNKLEVENFSGVTPDCIKQDFYATMLLKNLASMMVYDCKDNIEKAHNSSENKYTYKANMSCVISLIDDYIIRLFYSISNRSRNILLSNIYRNIIHAVIPVRPGRSYLRKKSHPSIKFAQNQR